MIQHIRRFHLQRLRIALHGGDDGLHGLFAGGKQKKDDPLAAYGVNMVKGLGKSGLSNYDIAWSQILPTAGAMVPNQAEVVSKSYHL